VTFYCKKPTSSALIVKQKKGNVMIRKLLIGAICVAAVALNVHCSAAGVGEKTICVFYVDNTPCTYECGEMTVCGKCISGWCTFQNRNTEHMLSCCKQQGPHGCSQADRGYWVSIGEAIAEIF
jgi:hypothetical protein